MPAVAGAALRHAGAGQELGEPLRGLVQPRASPQRAEVCDAGAATETAQARLQSAVIVEGHPVHDGLPCLLPSCETQPTHASGLQSTPEAFDGRVVPAIALATHRRTYAPAC